MNRVTFQVLLFVSFLAVHVGSAATTSGYIKDAAGFFSKDAIRVANDQINEIKKTFQREVQIETVVTIPMSKNRTPEMEAGTQPDPVFSEWAKKKLDSAGERNIFLVISKAPSYIMAAVGNQARNSGEFTENDRNALIKILATNFQARQYNKAMLESVHFVQDALQGNRIGQPVAARILGAPVPQQQGSPDVTFLWRWIGFGCAGLLAILLIVGLVRGYKTPAQLPATEETPTSV